MTRLPRTPPRRPQALASAEPWYHIGPVLAATATDAGEGESTGGDGATSADVYVYDSIGGWFGPTAEDFVRDVASLDVDKLVVHLNTPGGLAYEGIAVANVLRAHRAKVTVIVDGLAASAGSVIAMAGDEVVMNVGAQMMIHDAAGFCWGQAADMTKMAETLGSLSDSVASVYANRAGGTAAEWREVMRAETWYTAEEAVKAGLADRVATDEDKGTAGTDPIIPGDSAGGLWDFWDQLRSPDRFDLSAYAYAGRDHAPAPAMPARKSPAAPAAGSRKSTQERGPAVAFSDEQLTTLRQRLGTAEDADEATILAALDERLAEPAAPPNPPGTVVLDEAQHAQLLADARDGREARAQQLAEQRDRTVQAAVDDGRIPPARREHWVAQLAADPGAADVLANLKPGLVPLAETGYAGNEPTDPAAADDYWFAGVGAPAGKED